MKILITGAHFTPAVAVIEELKKQPDIEIIYAGRKSTMEGDQTPSIESQILPGLKVKFIPLIAGRIQRRFSIYAIISLLKLPIGFLQALYIILKYRPDVILSFGGYVSVPCVIVGWLFSVPIIIHEQTLISGLANQLNAFFADKIAVAFPQNNQFNKPVIVTGNPLRNQIFNPLEITDADMKTIITNAKIANLPLLLVTGGNQGSHLINLTLEKRLQKLTKIACIIHVTGSSKFNDYDRLKKLESERYLVRRWIGDEFGSILRQVDLIISRGGINTLTEIAFYGKPVLVIPLPFIYKNEQMENAKFFNKLGMAQILPQSELTPDNLVTRVQAIFKDLTHFKKNAANAKRLIVLDAAKSLALETILLSQPTV